MKHTLHVEAPSAGKRLDAFIAERVPNLSRGRVQALIDDGEVVLNGAQAKASAKVRTADVVIVAIPEIKPTTYEAQDIALDIIHEDHDIIVINKPAGLVVHPGAGNPDGTLMNALLHRYPDLAIGGHERPGIVHRLDKETSGVMVCARNDAAHQKLVKGFASRDVQKVYRAFCVGTFKELEFTLITGHRRHATDRLKYTTKLRVPEQGEAGNVKLAHSEFKVLAQGGGVAELEVEIKTGRTHQIRAHLADIHHPLLKDDLYGGVKAMARVPEGPVKAAAARLTRHALHAEMLSFKNPRSGEMMRFHAPLPADLQAVHDALAALM